jgi:hypothetical protein
MRRFEAHAVRCWTFSDGRDLDVPAHAPQTFSSRDGARNQPKDLAVLAQPVNDALRRGYNPAVSDPVVSMSSEHAVMVAAAAAADAPSAPSSNHWVDVAASFYRRHDGLFYALFCTICTVFVASRFYGYMLVQTHGVWSAPLDDVFIHFNYGRSFARGYPFHWTEGNGYSSGNTSLTYPITLALGYWMGFRDLSLAMWSGIIAVVSVVAFLVAAGHAVVASSQRRWLRYAIPPAVLSMGVLDWSLFSGMENAWHLGVWGLALVMAVRAAEAPSPAARVRRMLGLGLAGALLVATRPESAVCVAAFGVFAVWRTRGPGERRRWREVIALLAWVGTPSVLLLLLHALANLAFTGEWAASGAIAKLWANDPYTTPGEKWQRYYDLTRYILPRLFEHHFSETRHVGWLVAVVALVPLASRELRPLAITLWAQAIGWIAVVALNNQLRWQNERYAMPAVAWLMVLAGLGVASCFARRQPQLVSTAPSSRSLLRRIAFPLRATCGVVCIVGYWMVQAPRMEDQIWFFGRASRNILDQHVSAGRLLAAFRPTRVLVGDAGALLFASDRPGLDLIGLGGYHDLPFARSTVHGLGASIELIERIDPRDRPDMMAIYPSWWDDLPLLFGDPVASVPVDGNVICGGREKVIYRAEWDPLDREGRPRSLRRGERVTDELDVADLISESQHDYNLPSTKAGYVRYRVLADPDEPRRELFDAGRTVPRDFEARARLRRPSGQGRLILRVAPEHDATIEVRADGQVVGTLRAEEREGIWQELSLRLPETLPPTFEASLTPREGSTVHYHLWVVETVP